MTEKFLADKNPNKINLGVVSETWSRECRLLTKHMSADYACMPAHVWSPHPSLSVDCRQGAYRDDDGRPVVLPSVREAERRVAGSHFME